MMETAIKDKIDYKLLLVEWGLADFCEKFDGKLILFFIFGT